MLMFPSESNLLYRHGEAFVYSLDPSDVEHRIDCLVSFLIQSINEEIKLIDRRINANEQFQ